MLAHKMVSDSGGFRGGTPGPCPPFETFFYNCPPPLFVHVPPPPFENLKKKKMCQNTEMFRIPPVWDLRDYRLWWRSEKKSVGVPPPPPLRSSAFLGLARLSRLAAVRKKNQCCAPPPFLKILDPPLVSDMCQMKDYSSNCASITRTDDLDMSLCCY